MNVLLTGALGRLGRVVHQHLLTTGLSIRATDLPSGCGDDRLVIPADLLNYQDCTQLVQGIDAVVHLANHANPYGLPPQQLYAENMTMNVNLLEAALKAGVSKVIFASSIHVFCGPRRVSENHLPSSLPYLPLDSRIPAHPCNAYGLGKAATEAMLASMVEFRGLPCAVALRFPMLRREPPWLEAPSRHDYPHPEARLDAAFTYLLFADAAELIDRCLAKSLSGYRCYFPADNRPRCTGPSIAELVRQLFPDVPLRVPLEHMDSLVDLSEITHDIGWQPCNPSPSFPHQQGVLYVPTHAP